MKKVAFISSLMLFAFCSPVDATSYQHFELYNNDTINFIDVNSLKQGHWIYFGKDKKLKGYAKEQMVEERNYVDNRKMGIWKKYYPNGKTQNEITYKNSRPNGFAKIYYKNGNLKEEGLWKGNKWVGNYKFYHDNGNLYHEFAFNPKGKREGVQKYYHDNGQVMIEGEWKEGKESGVVKEYYENGEIKSEKFYSGGALDPGSTISYDREEPVKVKKKTKVVVDVVVEKDERPNIGAFDGNGYYKLYNRNRHISKDGVFKNNKLVDGKWYRYNSDGILQRIEVYKSGEYVGEAPIEDD